MRYAPRPAISARATICHVRHALPCGGGRENDGGDDRGQGGEGAGTAGTCGCLRAHRRQHWGSVARRGLRHRRASEGPRTCASARPAQGLRAASSSRPQPPLAVVWKWWIEARALPPVNPSSGVIVKPRQIEQPNRSAGVSCIHSTRGHAASAT
eukprot:scaffold7998_cov417-Prasinococcus_capsulatus_cf.AAC.11